jgi:hypothetical protein
LPVQARNWPRLSRQELKEAARPRYYPSQRDAELTLTVEAIGLYEVPVIDSDSQEALDRGVIYLPQTPMPWEEREQKNVFLAPATGSATRAPAVASSSSTSTSSRKATSWSSRMVGNDLRIRGERDLRGRAGRRVGDRPRAGAEHGHPADLHLPGLREPLRPSRRRGLARVCRA